MEGDSSLHNAEKAMHDELPSEAQAQRVRERLNELFAAVLTPAASAEQISPEEVGLKLAAEQRADPEANSDNQEEAIAFVQTTQGTEPQLEENGEEEEEEEENGEEQGGDAVQQEIAAQDGDQPPSQPAAAHRVRKTEDRNPYLQRLREVCSEDETILSPCMFFYVVLCVPVCLCVVCLYACMFVCVCALLRALQLFHLQS